MSMEEQRQRQEDEARRAAVASAAEAGISSPAADGVKNVHQLNLLSLMPVSALLPSVDAL